MADVFVSYVSEDRAIAEKISRGLEGAGFSVWWDKHIRGGVDFAPEIARQLDAAKVVIVLWSKASLESGWVRDEAQQARDENKLIPVRLDSIQPPLGFRQAQSLDFSGWNGDPTVGAFAALVDSARDFAGRSPTDPPPAVSSTTAPKRGRWRGTKIMIGVIAVLSLALAYFGVDKFWLSRPVTTEQPGAETVPTVAPAATTIVEKSIAILPFTDMSEKKDQEYLADGMAEEIINLLSQVPDLLVSARTSSFYFKGKPTKIPEIARELGVVHVLEGSVRRSGDHLRVTAQLVRADNGYHLWSETYDRDLHDVFKVQDDIANAVVQALQIKLMGGELSRQKGGTQNLAAYEHYLRAFNAFMSTAPNQRTSLDRANQYAREAISIDPNYGRAWWLLAWISQVEADDGWTDAREGYARARDLAQRALKISPGLADAHAVLQYLQVIIDWDWAAAEREGELALAIDPTEPFALQTAGLLSNALGRWDDAERQFRTALARDPLNWYLYFCLGRTYFGAGRFADAEAMFRKQQEMDATFRWTRLYLSRTLGAQGEAEAALALIEDESDVDVRLMALSGSLWAVGRRAEADAALQQQIQRLATIFPYSIAVTYAQRGEHESALQWLEKAYEQRDASLLEMIGEPLLTGLQGNERFKAFLHKMNLPIRQRTAITKTNM